MAHLEADEGPLLHATQNLLHPYELTHPPELKYPFHVLLVEHGKRCPRCAKNGKLQLPEEGTCPLINFSEKLEASVPATEHEPVTKQGICAMVRED